MPQREISTIHSAHRLYLNGKYEDALNEYKKLTGPLKLNKKGELSTSITDDNKLAFLQTLKILHKLPDSGSFSSQEAERQWQWQERVIEELLKTAKYFPSHIKDQAFLVEKAFPSSLYDRLITEDIAHEKILSTISYIKYFQKKSPEEAYQFFRGHNIEEALYSFSTLSDSNDNNILKNILSDSYKFGLLGPILSMQSNNRWRDTVPHNLIWSNNFDSALLYLEAAAKFDKDFLEYYLYRTQNYQGENWLHDIAESTTAKNLISSARKIFSDKKLEHFMSPGFCKDNYMKRAINKGNSEIVRGLIESVNTRSSDLGFCQRIFNVNSDELELSARYRSHQDLDFLRSIGLTEYYDSDAASYLKSFVEDKQNVHRSEFTEAIKIALYNLEKRYQSMITNKEAILTDFEKFFHSIKESINHKQLFRFLQNHNCKIFDKSTDKYNVDKVPSSVREKCIEDFLVGAELTLARIIDPKTFSQKYRPDTNQDDETPDLLYQEPILAEKTLQDALAYAWLGTLDKNSVKNSDAFSDKEIWDRKMSLVMTLYDTYKEGIGQQLVTDEDVKMSDTDDYKWKKSNIICNDGLFHRIICALTKVHDDVMIEIKPPEMKMTYSALQDNMPKLFSDIEPPTLLKARIYNSFEKLKNINPSKQFIPLKQYYTGLLKDAFRESFENNFFGNKESIPSDKDYIAFERALSEITLPNPIKKSLDNISQHNVNTIKSNMLFLKILMQSFACDDNFPYPSLFRMKIAHEIADQLDGNLSSNNQLSKIQDENLDLALELTAENFFTEETQQIAQKQPILERLQDQAKIYVNQNQNITKKSAFLEIAKMIRALAENKDWTASDALQFHEIITEQSLYPRQAIITDLFKHAIIQENLPMLQRILHKTEGFYETELDPRNLSMNQYKNPYLKAVADKDFGNGLNILHIASIHCKALDKIFDTMLDFHEFRNQINSPDKSKNTPSHSAAFNNNEVALKKLAEYNADINRIDSYGSTPIHTLADKGNLKLIQYLIENHAANPFARDNNKNTFVHNAALNFDGDISVSEFIEDLKEEVPISETIFDYDYSYISEILAGADNSSKIFSNNSEAMHD